MARRSFAKRYSQAAFEIALGKNELDRWQSDLKEIASLREDATLIAWLESPKVHFDIKARFLAERLKDINPLALNLACLLVARGRFGMVGDIADEYQRLLDGYHGVEQAEITTAVPLSDEDKQGLTERLGALFDKKVVLQLKTDSSIIGGIVARVGDKLLDGSTRSRLEALQRQLTTGSR